MMQTVFAVAGRDWKACPTCHNQTVHALENGFQVNGDSTDLLLCCYCGRFYIVFPDSYLGEVPKTVEVEIPEATTRAADEKLKQHQICRDVYQRLFFREMAANINP